MITTTLALEHPLGLDNIQYLTIADGSGHYLQLPKLTTTQRNALSAVNGQMIYNITTSQIEAYTGGSWSGWTVSTTWVSLTDTPGSITANYVVKGNSGGTALEMVATLPHERGGLEADVSAYSGLVKITGGATSAVTVTAAGEAILDDADASAQQTTLGLVIGTNVQAYDAGLADIAGLAVTDSNIIVGNGTNWVAESGATVRTSLGLGTGDSPQFTGLTLTGNLTVSGTTTTINSTTLTVDDKNIELGSVTTPSDTTADGGGITLKGATDKTIIWDNANDNWTFNQAVNLASGLDFKINNTSVLNATTLGGAVVSSSLTSVGTLTSLNVAGATTFYGTSTKIGFDAGATLTIAVSDTTGVTAITHAGSGVTVTWTAPSFDFVGAFAADALTLSDVLTFSDGGTIDNTDATTLTLTETTIAVAGILTVSGASTLSDTLTVGVDDTGHDIKFFGATSGAYFLFDESADAVVLQGGATKQMELRFMEDTDNGTNYVAFKSHATLAGNVTWILPNADSSGTQYLVSDGSGNLSWAAGGSPATLDAIGDVAAITEAQGQVIYYDGSNWNALDPGTTGQYLKTQGAAANPVWATAAGAGDVVKVGTPVDNQIGVWTGDGTLEGDTDFQRDGSAFKMLGTVFIKEQADAAADVAAYGQIWVNTATPNELWFTDDAGADIQLGIHYIEYRILDKDTSHTVSAGVGGDFRVPRAMTVLDVGAYVDTAGTTSVTTIDIHEAGTTILSTKITIDATEKTSETAATPPVISDSAIAADAILTFDIDGIASGTAGKGLVVWMKVIF